MQAEVVIVTFTSVTRATIELLGPVVNIVVTITLVEVAVGVALVTLVSRKCAHVNYDIQNSQAT